MKKFNVFVNESKLGLVVLSVLDRDELDEIESDSITSEWIEEERINIKGNELWVNYGDEEVLKYFDDHYGFILPRF
jgi:hypothetical protein